MKLNLRRWFHEHSLKLLAIRDTPHAIAGGVAIGVFFGFMPLFGLKTLLAIFFAWLTRSNILAAVLAGAFHDLILPFMPVIYRWEYDLGYWCLSNPHVWPKSFHKVAWDTHGWWDWRKLFEFLTGVGKPLVVGGTVCSAPFALVAFGLTKIIMTRHQAKNSRKLEMQAPPAEIVASEKTDTPEA